MMRIPGCPTPWPRERTWRKARTIDSGDRGIVATGRHVREPDTLEGAVQEGLDTFSHINMVSANADISPFGPETWPNDDRQWRDVIDANRFG